MASASDFFTSEQKTLITTAIQQAENATSGEVRLFIEDSCKADDVLDRAAFIFKELNIHQTKERNGVLFYLAITDRKFAIIGDGGINAVVGNDFWQEIKAIMATHFKTGEFTEGLSMGIKMAGDALKQHFPYQTEDVNELPDDIVFG